VNPLTTWQGPKAPGSSLLASGACVHPGAWGGPLPTSLTCAVPGAQGRPIPSIFPASPPGSSSPAAIPTLRLVGIGGWPSFFHTLGRAARRGGAEDRVAKRQTSDPQPAALAGPGDGATWDARTASPRGREALAPSIRLHAAGGVRPSGRPPLVLGAIGICETENPRTQSRFRGRPPITLHGGAEGGRKAASTSGPWLKTCAAGTPGPVSGLTWNTPCIVPALILLALAWSFGPECRHAPDCRVATGGRP
jgi:hypothetical protein